MATRKLSTNLRTNSVQNQNQDTLDLVAGSGVTLTNVGEKVTIASSGGGGSGTVTSVAETVPTEMTIGGSPITTAGTLALGWNSASGNKVIASPSGGGSGAYAGRALVALDIPNIAESQVTNLVSDLALKAPLASPALTGTPTAPTQSPGDNTTKIATDAFVTAAIGAIATPRLDQVNNPNTNKNFTMGANSLIFAYSGNAGALSFALEDDQSSAVSWVADDPGGLISSISVPGTTALDSSGLTGIVTQAAGNNPLLQGVYGDAVNNGTGTVTAAASLYADTVFNSGGGTTTNGYGLLIADQNQASNNWAIKTGLGLVEIGGDLLVHGVPTGPTAAPGTNTTQLATTAFVVAAGTGSGSNHVVDSQGPTGTLTGNSADQTVFTTTIGAAALIVGSHIRITALAKKLTGSGGSGYKIWFGATSLTLGSSVANSDCLFQGDIIVSGSSAQVLQMLTTQSSVAGGPLISTPAEAISGAIILKLTFNNANTNTLQGRFWLVEILTP